MPSCGNWVWFPNLPLLLKRENLLNILFVSNSSVSCPISNQLLHSNEEAVLFSKILNDILSCEHMHISGEVRFLYLLRVNGDTNVLKFLQWIQGLCKDLTVGKFLYNPTFHSLLAYLESAPEKKRRTFINPWIDTGYIYHKQDDQSSQLPQITQLDESKCKRKLSTDPQRLLLVNGWCLPCRTDRSPFPSHAGLQNSIFSYNIRHF